MALLHYTGHCSKLQFFFYFFFYSVKNLYSIVGLSAIMHWSPGVMLCLKALYTQWYRENIDI